MTEQHPLNIKIPLDTGNPEHYVVVTIHGGPGAERHVRDLLPENAFGRMVADAMRAERG